MKVIMWNFKCKNNCLIHLFAMHCDSESYGDIIFLRKLPILFFSKSNDFSVQLIATEKQAGRRNGVTCFRIHCLRTTRLAIKRFKYMKVLGYY